MTCKNCGHSREDHYTDYGPPSPCLHGSAEAYAGVIEWDDICKCKDYEPDVKGEARFCESCKKDMKFVEAGGYWECPDCGVIKI